MKELILNPPIFVAILFSLAASFIIVIYLTRDKAIAPIFEKIIVYIFLFTISDLAIFNYYHINIARLGFPQEGEVEDFIYRFFLLIIYAAAFVIIRARTRNILTNLILLFRQQFLGIYIGIAAFSMFWAVPFIRPLQTTLGLVILGTFAVHFGRRYNWRELSRLLRWNFLILNLLTIFTCVLMPSVGVEGKGWKGLFTHPNGLGLVVGLSALLWLHNFLYESKYRWRSLVFLILSFVVMMFSNSASSFISCMLSIIVLVLIPFVKRLKWKQAVIFFVTFLLVSSSAFILVINKADLVVSSFNRDLTFTGRIPLWGALIDLGVKHRPWLGYGYDSFWLDFLGQNSPAMRIWDSPAGAWLPYHAHNGFLDIFLSIGLFGFLVFVASFLVNVVRAIKLINIDKLSQSSTLSLMFLTYMFFRNLADTSLHSPNLLWFLYVLITVRLQIDVTKKRRNFSLRRVSRSPK